MLLYRFPPSIAGAQTHLSHVLFCFDGLATKQPYAVALQHFFALVTDSFAISPRRIGRLGGLWFLANQQYLGVIQG